MQLKSKIGLVLFIITTLSSILAFPFNLQKFLNLMSELGAKINFDIQWIVYLGILALPIYLGIIVIRYFLKKKEITIDPRFSHLAVHYSQSTDTPETPNPARPRFVLNNRKKQAFWASDLLEPYIKQHKIQWYSHDGEQALRKYFHENGIEFFETNPLPEQLDLEFNKDGNLSMIFPKTVIREVQESKPVSNIPKLKSDRVSSQTFKIGAITPQTYPDVGLWSATLSLAKADINSYCKDLGLNINFDFLIYDAQATPSIHLEKVMSFHSQGIDLIIGGGWSSQAQGALSYINENDMLLVSPISTSPLLRISDNLFRLCPNDLVQAYALAEMWKMWGIKGVIVFHRIDPWGEILWQVMRTELPKRNIEIIERVTYAPETTDFASYLAHMDDIVATVIKRYEDKKYVGVQIFSFDEQITYITQGESCPNIKDLIWMSTESGGRSQTYIDQIGGPLVPKRMFSPLIGPDESSSRWASLDMRYRTLTGQTASFYTGALYDSAWLIALSVLKAHSQDGRDVLPIFRNVASRTNGVTGLLSLDEYGDREPQVFDIWGYYKDIADNVIKFRKFGDYNGQSTKVTWDYAALAKVGIKPPSL